MSNTTNEQIFEWKKMIIESKTEALLDEMLLSSSIISSKEFFNKLIILQAELKELRNKELMSTLDERTIVIHHNQIKARLLYILDEISMANMSDALVLTRNKEKKRKNRFYSIIAGAIWLVLFFCGLIYGHLSSLAIPEILKGLQYGDKLIIKLKIDEVNFYDDNLEEYTERPSWILYSNLKRGYEKYLENPEIYKHRPKPSLWYLYEITDTTCNYINTSNINGEVLVREKYDEERSSKIMKTLAAYETRAAKRYFYKYRKVRYSDSDFLTFMKQSGMVISGFWLGHLLTFEDIKLDLDFDRESTLYEKTLRDPDFWCTLYQKRNLLIMISQVRQEIASE